MWEIWAKKLLPEALKSYPKCKKSPNLVTLVYTYSFGKIFTASCVNLSIAFVTRSKQLTVKIHLVQWYI